MQKVVCCTRRQAFAGHSSLQVKCNICTLPARKMTDLSQVDDSPIAELPSKVAKLVAAVAVRGCVHSWERGVP